MGIKSVRPARDAVVELLAGGQGILDHEIDDLAYGAPLFLGDVRKLVPYDELDPYAKRDRLFAHGAEKNARAYLMGNVYPAYAAIKYRRNTALFSSKAS